MYFVVCLKKKFFQRKIKNPVGCNLVNFYIVVSYLFDRELDTSKLISCMQLTVVRANSQGGLNMCHCLY